MKKRIILIFSLFISFTSFSQDSNYVQVILSWKIGTVKRIKTNAVSEIYIGDSLLTKTEVSSNYKITVVSETDSNFTIKYSQGPNDFDINISGNDSVIKSANFTLQNILKVVEEELKKVNFLVLINKETGLAYAIKNEEEVLNSINNIAKSVALNLGESNKVEASKIDSISSIMKIYTAMMKPKIIQTTINSINQFQQIYSLQFIENSYASYPFLAYDINAMGKFGDTEFPVTMHVNAKSIDDNNLILSTNMEYDQNFLLKQMQASSPNMSELTIDNLNMIEKEDFLFDLNTGWLKESNSYILFDMPNVKVINTAITTVH